MSSDQTELLSSLERALAKVIDPDIRRPITELGMVQGLKVTPDGVAHLTLKLTIAGCPAARQLESQSREALLSVSEVTEAVVTVETMTAEERNAFIARVKGDRGSKALQFTGESITRVIAITSGKGGVGKSTVTANLAVALAREGLKVGIIDADIFGFSIPQLMGLTTDSKTASPLRINDMILAPEAHGVKVISIGMFLGDKAANETAISWRGPMLHRTIEQFLRDVWFGDLDVLLLDFPPGTGDVALSISQLLPGSEVIVVTTPQLTASDVAIRSAILAFEGGQRVLGVVENMAGFTLPDGTLMNLFGAGGGQNVATVLSNHEKNTAKQKVRLLASIPLSTGLREHADEGKIAVLEDPNDPASQAIIELSKNVMKTKNSIVGKKLPIHTS